MHHRGICVPTRTNDISDLVEKVKSFALSSRSQATTKAYRREWNHFERWCCDYGLATLPATPESVAVYIADCASTWVVGTITRLLAAISTALLAAGYPTTSANTKLFIVGEKMKGIKRALGTASTQQIFAENASMGLGL